MIDPNFDPLQALTNLDQNVRALIKAHNALADKVQEHEQTIDVLIKGLNAANAANMRLMEQGLQNLSNQFTSTGQH
jgi:flagellar biosynthesis/type III secretory pathway chaperone